MLSRVGSPFVVLEMGADEVMQFEPPPGTTQQQQQQQSPSKAAVRRRLSRFRSPGKQKHPGKVAGGSKGQGQAGSLRLLLGSGSGNGSGGSASGEKENVQLRELLVSQLDLIQRQSEDIVKKDRKLRELQRENEALRKRLTNIEFKEQKKPEPETEEAVSQPPPFAEAAAAYFVLSGESHIRREREEVKQILSHAEVPGWRVKAVPPSYSQQQAATQEELVDDDALLKRHNKPEVDEKRRKRWDIQRMREQRQVARLKARYEKSPRPGPASKARKKEWMEACDPLGITHVHVGESVPVVAWKAPMPVMLEEDFELPWNRQ